MGRSVTDPKKDIRICNQHEVDTRKVLVSWKTCRGIRKTKEETMNIPLATTKPNTRKSIERNDRLKKREIHSIKKLAKNGDHEAAVKYFDMLSNTKKSIGVERDRSKKQQKKL
jgi:hypothetical protein